MASMIQLVQASDDTTSPIRALHSLRDGQVASILGGLMSLRSEWCIERHESCDGHLSIMFVHLIRDTTIVVDRDASGILLNVMLDDELQASPRRCSSIIEVVDALKIIAGSIGPSDTRHTA